MWVNLFALVWVWLGEDTRRIGADDCLHEGEEALFEVVAIFGSERQVTGGDTRKG